MPIVRIASYDPTNMHMLASDISVFDFGNAIRGQHADNIIALRPEIEFAESLTNLAVFLEDNGGLDRTRFGKMKSMSAITGVVPGDARLSDFFIQVPGISDFSAIEEYSDHGIVLSIPDPEYIWMDAEIGDEEVIGSKAINLRFIFEYI